MGTLIDVRLEALAGRGAPTFSAELIAGTAIAACDAPTQSCRSHDRAAALDARTFYLETFGCQMNAHDS